MTIRALPPLRVDAARLRPPSWTGRTLFRNSRCSFLCRERPRSSERLAKLPRGLSASGPFLPNNMPNGTLYRQIGEQDG
jgi:hypothetical protein